MSKDVYAIVNLWTEFMEDHDNIVLKINKKLMPYTLRKKSGTKNFSEFVNKCIKSKNMEIYIAKVDDVSVGYSLIYIKDEIPIFKVKKLGYISDLFVKKEFRKKKISSKLMAVSMAWFRKKGLKHTSIILYADNPYAHTVYKKWGFFDYKIEMRRNL